MPSLVNFLKVLSTAVTLGLGEGVAGQVSVPVEPFLYFSFLSFGQSFKKETQVLSVLRSDCTYVLV